MPLNRKTGDIWGDNMARLLIVEDDAAIVRNLSDYLRGEGFDVASATTASGALELAGADFDLVLLDVGLPDGSGFALCSEIKGRFGTPVIFLTAGP